MIAEKSFIVKRKLETEYELLLLLSKLQLSEADKEEATSLMVQVTNWNLFTERCIGTYLAAIVYTNLGLIEASVPKEVEAALANSYNQILVRNIRLYQSFTTVLSGLNEAKIDCIPLKGIYLAETVYKNLGLRHLSDIDLLVRSADADKVRELMDRNGWTVTKVELKSELEKEQFTPAHPYTFRKNGVTIELHTHLYNRNQRAAITEEELWTNTHSEVFCDGTIRQFSSEMLLQHLCLHLYKHLIGADCKLVSFCDIREVIIQRKQDLDWEEFKRLCKKFSCLDEVAPVLLLCRNYWYTEVPNWFFDNVEAEARMEDKFVQFLTKNGSKAESLVERSLVMLNSIDGFGAKVRFVLGFIFPRPAFMYRHFQLKDGTWLLPWYLLRVFNLFRKLLAAVFSRLKRAFA